MNDFSFRPRPTARAPPMSSCVNPSASWPTPIAVGAVITRRFFVSFSSLSWHAGRSGVRRRRRRLGRFPGARRVKRWPNSADATRVALDRESPGGTRRRRHGTEHHRARLARSRFVLDLLPRARLHAPVVAVTGSSLLGVRGLHSSTLHGSTRHFDEARHR